MSSTYSLSEDDQGKWTLRKSHIRFDKKGATLLAEDLRVSPPLKTTVLFLFLVNCTSIDRSDLDDHLIMQSRVKNPDGILQTHNFLELFIFYSLFVSNTPLNPSSVPFSLHCFYERELL